MPDETYYQSIHTGQQIDDAVETILSGAVEDAVASAAQSASEAAQSAIKAENAYRAPPYIGDNGNWMTIDPETGEYFDTEKTAVGPKGDSGKDATINGVNTIEIKAGKNIQIKQDGNFLFISSSSSDDYNFLDNWDFRHPINQRAVSGTITSTGYFIDRWILTNGSVSLTKDGIILNGTIKQIVDTEPDDEFTASALTPNGLIDATYDVDSKTFSVTATGETIVAVALNNGEISSFLSHGNIEKQIAPEIWSAFMQSAGKYYELWDASGFTFSPFDDTVVKDQLLLRKDEAGTVITAKELFGGNPDAGDLIILTMLAISESSNGGDYIDQDNYAMIKEPTWYQFQYALIHRETLSYLPSTEICKAEAENKYFWKYMVIYPTQDQTTELAKCQQYYLVTDFVFAKYYYNGGFALRITTPVTMKRNVSVEEHGGDWSINGGSRRFYFPSAGKGTAHSNYVLVSMTINNPETFSCDNNNADILEWEGEGSSFTLSAEPQIE